MTRRDGQTLDLLDWQPPQLEQRFSFEEVRAARLSAAMAKAISLSLKQCGKSREEVAQEMSAFLGEKVPVSVLNAYASEAREDHNISAVRLVALVHATQDRRLFSLLCEQFGWAVVDRRYLKFVEAKMYEEKAETFTRKARVLLAEAGR